MTTPLIIKSVSLNQELDNLFLLGMRLRLKWEIKHKTWLIEKNQSNLKAFYFCIYYVLSLVIVPIPLILSLNYILSLDWFSKTVIIAWGFFGFFAPFVFFFDILIVWFGEELVFIVNYLIRRERQISRQFFIIEVIPKVPTKGADFKFTMAHLREDPFGVVLASYLVGIYVLTFAIPIFSATNNLDPISVCIGIMLGLPTTFSGKLIFMITKLLILIPLAYVATTVVRTFFPLLLFLGMLIIKVERQILQMPSKRMGLHLIRIYRELIITFQILRPFLSFLLITFLTSNLFGLIFTINGSLIGWKFLPWNFYILNPTGMITLLVYLELLFKGGSLFYLTSVNIIRKWKLYGVFKDEGNAITNINFGSHYKKVLRSLQPLKIPVGHVVSIDLGFKVKYLEFVQGRVMESVLALQEWNS